MNRLGLAVTLLAMLTSAAASAIETPVEYKEGRVVYVSSCEVQRAFLYFDGDHYQKPCLGSTAEFSARDIINLSRQSLCRNEIRVNAALVQDGVLYASDVEEGRNCADGGRRRLF